MPHPSTSLAQRPLQQLSLYLDLQSTGPYLPLSLAAISFLHSILTQVWFLRFSCMYLQFPFLLSFLLPSWQSTTLNEPTLPFLCLHSFNWELLKENHTTRHIGIPYIHNYCQPMCFSSKFTLLTVKYYFKCLNTRDALHPTKISPQKSSWPTFWSFQNILYYGSLSQLLYFEEQSTNWDNILVWKDSCQW